MTVKASGFSQTIKTWGALPPQKVSSKIKNTEAWRNANVDAIIAMAQSGSGDGRASKYNKQVNYDILNSRFKQEDFTHVLDPYGLNNPKFTGSATKMQNYNIVRQAFETLKGEEMKIGMNFRAVAINGEAVLDKNKERQTAITEAIKARAIAIATDDINPETGEPNAPNLEDIDTLFKTEYAHPTEIAANQILKFLTRQDRLQMKFSKGWEHALITAEEIYYASIKGGHPSLRVCNPLNVSFDRDGDNPFIHESDWAMEERWVPRGTVIDLYGEDMPDDLVQKLDNGELGGTTFTSNGMQLGFAYDFNGGMRRDTTNTQNTSHVYIANCAWRSYRQLGKLSYLDPRTGMVESTTVDDTFKMTEELKELGAKVSWYWETEIWTGTRIGSNNYINVRPLENQTGNLPYIGYVYNNINSVATSLVDMVKAHQYTYIIVWYRLEQELAKAKGKKFIMDIAQLPKSKGWTMDQWMYYFDNLGVAWVNSLEEGRKGDPSSIAKFNQFSAVDMSLSNIVQQYMMILQKLEQQVEKITGVSPQRAGDIGTNETATGAQRAIIQSTNNTKPLFFYHDITREVALQELLELGKVAYADGTSLEFLADEKTVETIKLDAGMLNGTDLGVFMSNSFEDAENLQKLERYLEVALQTDKANLSDIVSVLGSKSLSQVKDTIIAGERDKINREQEAYKQQQESQVQIQQRQSEDLAAERELKLYEIDSKNATAIEVKTMELQLRDIEENNINTDIENRKIDLETRKVEIQDRVKNKELQLKQSMLEETKRSNKAKEQISKNKPNATKR